MGANIRVSTVAGLLILLPALSTAAEAQTCEPLVGNSGTLTGKITGVSDSAGSTVYDLYLEDDQTPCFTDSFEFVDPAGKNKCKEGQMLTGTGVLSYDANLMTATITGTEYSCQ